MAREIWVKAAHARAQFYQDVLNDKGELVAEHVRAETDADGKAVPVPFKITLTNAAAKALYERYPDTEIPSRIVECSADEVAAYLAGKGEAAPEAEKPKARSKQKAAE